MTGARQMMTVTILFRRYNENSYRSYKEKKHLIYTEIRLASGLSLDRCSRARENKARWGYDLQENYTCKFS